MSINNNEITEKDHWEGFHQKQPRMKLPSKLVITTRNIQDLLGKNISAGQKVLEIGFAPGKQLSYVASKYHANVTGLDYSSFGVETAKKLFDALNINAEVLCESIFETSLKDETFDVVYSIGVVEHFNDPTEIIRKHVRLTKKGGKAILAIPNYGGVYGKIQKWFDSANIDIHNLEMMNERAFGEFVRGMNCEQVEVYRYGRFDPSIISWRSKLPKVVARLINYLGTAVGHLMPTRMGALSPWLILEVRK